MNFSFRSGSHSDQAAVLEVFQCCSSYFLKIDGTLPTLRTVQLEMLGRPEERSSSYLKDFLLISLDGMLIGVSDLHVHHPTRGTATLGAFLIKEECQGLGLGRAAYLALEEHLRSFHSISTLLLSVSDRNDVAGFWRKMGFFPTGLAREWQGEAVLNTLSQFRKDLV